MLTLKASDLIDKFYLAKLITMSVNTRLKVTGPRESSQKPNAVFWVWSTCLQQK